MLGSLLFAAYGLVLLVLSFGGALARRPIMLNGVYLGVLIVGVAGPLVLSDFTFQLAVLWMMILFAMTWDIMGGQMGYNSLGNIFFFGAGMYIAAIVQVGLVYDVAEYTSAYGAIKVDFTDAQYFTGLVLGLLAAAVGAVVCAILLGSTVFGLRGAYFAIGTLGLALAAAELIGGWEYVGGGGGISMPVYPGDPDDRSLLFYYLIFGTTVATFAFLRWLYSTRFGLAINAIRDSENKADAMGIHTRRYKTVAWSVAAFFLGIIGAVFGNMAGFIEPLEVAFPTVTFGIFMVAMALLGGKGTLWGPVIGAIVFHVVKELTWTYLLDWQWVALGALIVFNVVFFQQGILGWAMERWPERFGIVVEQGRADEDDGMSASAERARS
jgi:branched-chain amino acid transport system permease protein